MSIPARYSGLCIECGERWQPGDLCKRGHELAGDSDYMSTDTHRGL